MMPCKEEDARMMFRNWLDDGAELALMLFGPGLSPDPQLSLSGNVFVKEVADEFVGFSFASGAGGVSLSFSGCRFSYSDPREAPALVRDEIESKYKRSLSMTLPSGFFVVFNEKN